MSGWVTERHERNKRRCSSLTTSRRAASQLAAALALAALPLAAVAQADVEQNAWYRAGRLAIERMHVERPAANRAKNVILFVGDGMSVTTVTAARILEGQLAGEPGEENSLAFEDFEHLALSKTYNTNQQVADSAGTMTAMVSGIKTKAGVLGVDESAARGDHRAVTATRVPTLFELAEAHGMATGIVTTTRITHATPAACYAHSPERDWENDSKLSPAARADGFPDIALQLLRFPMSAGSSPQKGDGLEVALGGGRQEFLPGKRGKRLDGRDLIAEWQTGREGATYVSNTGELSAVTAGETKQLLGLFHPSHISFDADRGAGPEGEPSLAQMTAKAIEILSQREAGFVLLVEAGRIDHAHHINNAYRALTDTIALSDAVRRALELTKPDETLIVTTADHSHTLTMAGYPNRGNDILGLVRGNDLRGEVKDELTLDMLGKPYTTLSYANGPGYSGESNSQAEGPKHFPHSVKKFHGITKGRPDLAAVATNDENYLQESTAPLGYETHAGEDVAIYARGPSAWLFSGVVEQNYIFHAITEALGWNSEPDGAAPGSDSDD